jgi:hypothetical protein
MMRIDGSVCDDDAGNGRTNSLIVVHSLLFDGGQLHAIIVVDRTVR